jgi:TonB family protein
MNSISAAQTNKSNLRHRRTVGALVLALAVACLALAAGTPLTWSQQEPNPGDRKLITRIEPQYPATLERLYIGGVVRLELVVAANGTVQGAKLIGGNPILGQSAIAAVKQWKYAPGRSETKTVVRLEFDPHR